MHNIVIDSEFKAYIRPLSDEEKQLLTESLVSEGCRDPLVVWQGENILLDGHNRYEICSTNNIKYQVIYLEFATREKAFKWLLRNQLGRRNVTPDEASYYRGELYSAEKKEIGENQYTSGEEKVSPPKKTAQKVAEMTGVSDRTVKNDEKYSKAVNKVADTFGVEMRHNILGGGIKATRKDVQKLAETIDKEPEKAQLIVNRVDEGEVESLTESIAVQNRLDRVEQVQVVEPTPIEEIQKRYNVIYADPPWRYDFSETSNREIENHYPTMDNADIAKLPVQDIAANDCVLIMWATAPKLLEAIEVIQAWGFTYKTHAIWDKEKIGTGYYFRGQHELLMIATKGALPVPKPENRVSSVIRETRGKHSEKPHIVYDIIDSMYPEYDKIELFARNDRDGWDGWGNQYGKAA